MFLKPYSGEIMAASDKCKTCTGRKVVNETKILEVNVEPGMRDEQRIIFRGEGDQMPGVEPGDVYIVLNEKPHPEFKWVLLKVLFLFVGSFIYIYIYIYIYILGVYRYHFFGRYRYPVFHRYRYTDTDTPIPIHRYRYTDT